MDSSNSASLPQKIAILLSYVMSILPMIWDLLHSSRVSFINTTLLWLEAWRDCFVKNVRVTTPHNPIEKFVFWRSSGELFLTLSRILLKMLQLEMSSLKDIIDPAGVKSPNSLNKNEVRAFALKWEPSFWRIFLIFIFAWIQWSHWIANKMSLYVYYYKVHRFKSHWSSDNI